MKMMELILVKEILYSDLYYIHYLGEKQTKIQITGYSFFSSIAFAL